MPWTRCFEGLMLGLDYLGLGSRHWNVAESLKAFPQGWALGVFADDTFGPNVIKNTKALLDSGKVGAVRAHMHWSYQHKIAPLDKLKKLLPKWEQLAQQYHVPFYISHSCEYSENNRAEILKRVNLVKELAPSCFVVQSPMHSPVISGYMVEEHGSSAVALPGGIASTDGSNLSDINASAWVKKNSAAALVFGWGIRFNLAKAGDPIPAPERKAFPDANYIKQVVCNLLPKGECPAHTAPGKVIPFKKPLLYKVMAEDTGDKRANRPLVILPEKGASVEICTLSGAIFGRFLYFGGFPPNLHRFYSGVPGAMNLYGWQIAQRCKDISGTEWGYVRQGKKFYGPINFAFREGFYQK